MSLGKVGSWPKKVFAALTVAAGLGGEVPVDLGSFNFVATAEAQRRRGFDTPEYKAQLPLAMQELLGNPAKRIEGNALLKATLSNTMRSKVGTINTCTIKGNYLWSKFPHLKKIEKIIIIFRKMPEGNVILEFQFWDDQIPGDKDTMGANAPWVQGSPKHESPSVAPKRGVDA